MKFLGTILPDPAKLEASDAFMDRAKRQAERAADKKHQGYERREIGGESRWYKTETVYVTAKGRWFEVREDGDYAVGDPAERWN
jgi:hypothetical protein